MPPTRLDAEQLAQLGRAIEELAELWRRLQAGNDCRPPRPTAGWCLVPPRSLRWVGVIEVQPHLYQLLGVLLPLPLPVAITTVEELLGVELTDRRLRCQLSRLNMALLEIAFPWAYGCSGGYVVQR